MIFTGFRSQKSGVKSQKLGRRKRAENAQPSLFGSKRECTALSLGEKEKMNSPLPWGEEVRRRRFLQPSPDG
jgi:hypothetical protein